MTNPAPNWTRIRRHYAAYQHAILSAPANVWAIDPYAWDHEAGIFLTPIEVGLWHDIRSEGAVMYPQYPVGPYFVDFASPVAKVAIECDGAAWHVGNEERDGIRQARIEALGWEVHRITGRECLKDFEEQIDPETGRSTWIAGSARTLIRDVCRRHGISTLDVVGRAE